MADRDWTRHLLPLPKQFEVAGTVLCAHDAITVVSRDDSEALQEAAPLDALIIDTSPPGSRLLGHPVFQQAASQLPPLLIISSLDTFASRLQAVRAGAVGFFTKPVDLPLLERRLERGFNNQQGGPFRVLIVDDDAELTARYQLVLSNAGIRVDAVSDPNLLLEKMRINFAVKIKQS